MNLNEGQLKAVTCDLKPALVIAGPGSGKTHVLINRINYMIKKLQCEPRHILVVTFSKMAAIEMKERFMHTFNYGGVTFGTLHSVFFRILRRAYPNRYQMEQLLLEDKKKQVIQNLYAQMEVDEGEEFMENFLRHLSLMKNQLIDPKNYYPEGLSKEIFYKLYKAYDAYKERHGVFDFDDMLVECYQLLMQESGLLRAVQSQYQYVLIDEFQDINKVQFEIIKLLAGQKEQLFVVGDDDQSIYRFRGANPSFLLDFKSHFKETQEIFLEVNYRSTKQILKQSLALIEHNTKRYQKALSTPNELGEMPQIIQCKDSKAEALDILKKIAQLKAQGESLNEMAVIYRTNRQATPIVSELLAANISFSIRDGMTSLYDQWITKDIFSYLHLAQNINQPELALRIMNKPKRYISQVVMQKVSGMQGHLFMNLLGLEELNEWQKNDIQQLLFDLQVLKEKSLQEALRYIRTKIGYDQYVLDYAAYRKIPHTSLIEVLDDLEESAKEYASAEEWEKGLSDLAIEIKKQVREANHMDERLTLTTMHAAKGLEFKYVFIIDVVEGTIPHHKSQTVAEEEEERRLMYVAMTRAKKQLFMYVPSEKNGKEQFASCFLKEIAHSEARKHLKEGGIIYHKKLGKGRIIEVINQHVLKVCFKENQIRKIDSDFCLNNGIITWEEKRNEK